MHLVCARKILNIDFLMKKPQLLLLTLLSIAFFAAGQEAKLYDTEIYRTRTALFKSETLAKNQIIFLGNSLTQNGKWEEYFPEQQPVNRGIIGDNTDGILARLDEIIEAQPRKLFFLSGVNDISQNYSNDFICNNMKEIITRIKAGSPETVIYFQSLLPINNSFERYKKLIGKEKQIRQLNKKIKQLCKKENIIFINLYPSFQSEKQLLNPAITNDGLHLTAAGYEIWVNLIRTYIEEQD